MFFPLWKWNQLFWLYFCAFVHRRRHETSNFEAFSWKLVIRIISSFADREKKRNERQRHKEARFHQTLSSKRTLGFVDLKNDTHFHQYAEFVAWNLRNYGSAPFAKCHSSQKASNFAKVRRKCWRNRPRVYQASFNFTNILRRALMYKSVLCSFFGNYSLCLYFLAKGNRSHPWYAMLNEYNNKN